MPRNTHSTTLTGYKLNRFGLLPFRSPLLGECLRFLFLSVLRCFTSRGIATGAYEFSTSSHGITRTGLPHSEISGSKPVCGSPKHIAAYHVLHRLLTPSHPPQTLRSLTLCLGSRAKLPAIKSSAGIRRRSSGGCHVDNGRTVLASF